ncbi:hypothetical protein SADUNF_Sadunf05G0048600 [Salix dunnii]|uniref:Uncharacterized protein n=1 Tax=Salix dunnii TaxID=1413687 RepID=A0A835N1T3_9ROSI|nr:hypothetical protein SADUNF_Sadunf05G0048600 [Salix dunnii]
MLSILIYFRSGSFCTELFAMNIYMDTNKIILDLSRERQQKSLRGVMFHETAHFQALFLDKEKDGGMHQQMPLTRSHYQRESLLGFKDGGNSVFAAPTSPLTSSLNGQINGSCPFHHHVPVSHEKYNYAWNPLSPTRKF